jgi:hypothetical protein
MRAIPILATGVLLLASIHVAKAADPTLLPKPKNGLQAIDYQRRSNRNCGSWVTKLGIQPGVIIGDLRLFLMGAAS